MSPLCHSLIRDFEKEVRTDDVQPSELAARKRELTHQLNRFVGMKKQHSASAQQRAALMGKGGIAAAATEPKHSKYDSEWRNLLYHVIYKCRNLQIKALTLVCWQ